MRQEGADARHRSDATVSKSGGHDSGGAGFLPRLEATNGRTLSRHATEGPRVTYLLIGLGGFLGSNARYLVAGWITERYGAAFPYGTLVINVSGSFLLGLFLVLVTDRFIIHAHWRLFFAIGFLGGYTTFSTFSFESAALLFKGSFLMAVANMAGSVLLGQIAVVLGMMVARLF